MDTSIHPHDFPRVHGHVMVAPAGTDIPPVRVHGFYPHTSETWPRDWRMVSDIAYLACVVRGCGCNAGQWLVVFRGGLTPRIPYDGDGLTFAMSVDTGDFRLDVPVATRCPNDARWRSGGPAYHAGRLDADLPWSLLVPNYVDTTHPTALMVAPVPASRVANPVAV